MNSNTPADDSATESNHAKRNHESSGPHSPCKIKKMESQPNSQESTSSCNKRTATGPSSFSKIVSSATLDNKMSNVAKLRQQFIEEVKDIELSLKETINDYKTKISTADRKSTCITEKLREINKLLCNQSEIIFTKARENKILREKLLELYDYQKIIFENIEDVSKTLDAQKNLSDNLQHVYDTVSHMQQMNNEKLKEKLNGITPDPKYSHELIKLNVKINELEQCIQQKKNLCQKLEMEIKSVKINKEEDQKKIKELDKIINELKKRNDSVKQKNEDEKSNLKQEINNLKEEAEKQIIEITKLENSISKLNQDIQLKKTKNDEMELELNEVNKELQSLSEKNEELKNNRCNEDNEQANVLQQLKEQLKISQTELESIKQKEIKVESVIKNKSDELRAKLKSYNGLELKLNKIELAIKKEQEAILSITKESESKTKDYDDKIKSIESQNIQLNSEINYKESKIRESIEKIKSLEESVSKLNEKLKAKINIREKCKEEFSQVAGPSRLPELFTSDTEKQKNRKKLYTPTLADDDLEIDGLSLEDQLTHLTQSKSSSSESPEKSKRFFRTSNLSQTRSRKESTPRGKGRAKKN